ncbi:lipopolysaccharide-induced tumor necrosis factor-alpha factor-like [Aethina tumida]|uniref:lipopolysaccharide-induced tumor necrosis factor-alpha factor-like n=1 Tax=Aethina tumida TaxID=116153 RepID=UPI00096B16C9|nr:lipopolysaccharide-induced tumor necrosis factor-alpha factor-like [Aethina tumida]
MEKGNPPPYPAYPSLPPESPPMQATQAFIPPPLGPDPSNTICHNCRAHIRTTVTTQANTKTHLFAFLCCLAGCWLCCCIPYCVDSCMSKRHECPECHAFLGEYQG